MTLRPLVALGLALCTAAALGGAPSAQADGLVLPPIPALRGLPIPSLPTDLLVPSYVGAPAAAQPIAHPPIPQNPHLAPNGRSSMHNDSYSSDAYAVAGPLGRNPKVTSASYGVRECATVTFDSQGRIEALCGGLDGFTMMLIDPVTLAPLSELPMPGRDLLSLTNPFTDLCGGTYFVLTADDRALSLTTTGEIWEVVQPGGKLAKGRSWPLAGHLANADDCLVALTLDWSGRAWFFSQAGVVGTLDLVTGAVRTLTTGEGIFNSVSADETGGVYAVTTHATYRFDADAGGAPTVTWRETYDRGTRTKPGMLSQGSGTSPTLIGDRWIVVADNADPRMNVLVYDRRTGVVGPRLHCATPVFGDNTGATENSLVAAGNSVIVENNYGYASPLSTLLGKSTTPGIARVMIEPDGCPVAWTNSSVAPTSVPKASLGNGLLYAYTKPPRSDTLDAWYVTAIDIRTGKTAWSKLTGTGIQWNNHYASFYLGPDGTAYIATLVGLVRLVDRP